MRIWSRFAVSSENKNSRVSFASDTLLWYYSRNRTKNTWEIISGIIKKDLKYNLEFHFSYLEWHPKRIVKRYLNDTLKIPKRKKWYKPKKKLEKRLLTPLMILEWNPGDTNYSKLKEYQNGKAPLSRLRLDAKRFILGHGLYPEFRINTSFFRFTNFLNTI